MANEEFILDGIAQLDAGMNSGYEPHLLAPNQTAFSLNATHRGAFIGPRPGMRKLQLNFGGDVLLQTLMTKNRWQGGTFYRADDGTSSLVVAIAGHLFQVTPDQAGAPTATVVDRTIPGDANPPTPPQAFLWQTEKWVVWNDGGSVPVFFDGATSRRSNSVQQTYGTTALNFTIPAVGVTQAMTLTAPYTGPANAVVLIDGFLFQVTSGATGYNAALTALFINAPITYPVGSQVFINPNLFGVQNTTVNFPPAVAGHTFGPGGISITLTLTAPYAGAIGDKLLLFGVRWKVTSIAGQFVLVKNDQTVTMPASLAAGTVILKFGSNLPNTVVGSLFAPFTAPGVGGTGTASLTVLYSGPAGQVVFIGSDQYTIAPLPPPPPGNVIQVININGTPAAVINAGALVLSIPELPPGRMGAYGLGQNFVALTDGISFIASDIVGSSTGTQSENYRDAVLRTVQSTSIGGLGNFRVPGTVGDIRALAFVANLDVSLGQGPLQIFTSQSVFSCIAPISVTLLNNTNFSTPIVAESLKGAGASGPYDLALSNSDIIFGSSDNAIRSLKLSRLDFDKWPNTPISREMARILALNDVTLLQYGSLVDFDNRTLKTQLPTNGPLGVFHQGLSTLNFDPISSIRGKAPSVWDGFWTGLNIFQMMSGMVNGVPRCYAFAFNAATVEIELWEILADTDANFDNVTTPITWAFESAALFNGTKGKGKFDLIELLDAEIYLRDIRGIVDVQTWYRPDYSECWAHWHDFTICAANAALTDPKQFRTRLGLGEPDVADCEPTNNRPYRIGNTFQFRIQITGACKFMGALFKAKPSPETEFSTPICEELCDTVQVIPCEPCKIQSPCITFPTVFYNLGLGKTYANFTETFTVTCPDGSIQNVTIQGGTIQFTMPYPVGYTGVYPPIVLGCVGGNIVKNIPAGATQDQIDAIIQGMIQQCAQATAQSLALCPVGVTNDAVFFPFPCDPGNVLTFTGVLPAWITIDTINSQLVGAAGTFSADTKTNANAAAQAALNTFAQNAITTGTLSCQPSSNVCTDGVGSLLSNLYQISGYFDGMVNVGPGIPAGGKPVWDGIFHVHSAPANGWFANIVDTYQVTGNGMCNASIIFNGCFGGIPQWTLEVDGGDGVDWVGIKVGGQTPEGSYPRTAGNDPGPASMTIVKIGGNSAAAGGIVACGN